MSPTSPRPPEAIAADPEWGHESERYQKLLELRPPHAFLYSVYAEANHPQRAWLPGRQWHRLLHDDAEKLAKQCEELGYLVDIIPDE